MLHNCYINYYKYLFWAKTEMNPVLETSFYVCLCMGNTLQSSVVKPDCWMIKDINIICDNSRNTLLFNNL